MTNPLFERIARRLIAGPIALYRAVLFTKSAARRHGAAVASGRRRASGASIARPSCRSGPRSTTARSTPAASRCSTAATPRASRPPRAASSRDALLARRRCRSAARSPLPARAGEAMLIHNHLWHRSGREPHRQAPERGLGLLHERGDALPAQEARAAHVRAAVRLRGRAGAPARLLDVDRRLRAALSRRGGVVARFRAFVAAHADCFERACVPGHVTGSAWLVSHDRRAVSADPPSEARALAAARWPFGRRSRYRRRRAPRGERGVRHRGAHAGADRRRRAAARSRRARDPGARRRARPRPLRRALPRRGTAGRDDHRQRRVARAPLVRRRPAARRSSTTRASRDSGERPPALGRSRAAATRRQAPGRVSKVGTPSGM